MTVTGQEMREEMLTWENAAIARWRRLYEGTLARDVMDDWDATEARVVAFKMVRYDVARYGPTGRKPSDG